jgi:hypothetical protein
LSKNATASDPKPNAMIVFSMVTDELPLESIPLPELNALFEEKVQPTTAGEDPSQCIPPPSKAEFQEKLQFVTVAEDDTQHIPPPLCASLL